MKATIALLPGDGIGPEVTAAAVAILQAVASAYQHEFLFFETKASAIWHFNRTFGDINRKFDAGVIQ